MRASAECAPSGALRADCGECIVAQNSASLSAFMSAADPMSDETQQAASAVTEVSVPSVRFRVRLPGGAEIGPGKIELLSLIGQTGSISEAARRMDMSYRRAWLLIDHMNRLLPQPVVTAQTGGRKGGGAALTECGRELVRLYGEFAVVMNGEARRRFASLSRR